MDTRVAASLLDEFSKLSGRIERPQTFLEIGGYPHYENQCSNFLAFFLDPEGPHGLGNLFLNALADSVSIVGREEGLGGNVSVEREVSTDEGNRIDLLIKSDSHAMLIENKIFAPVANPFEDYAAYLNSLKNESGDAYDDENKIKILLTLYSSGEGAEWGFINLTHADFASAVRSALGYHVSEADTRYLTLVLDFLNTLEHLGEGTRMNQEFVKLLEERYDEVVEFLTKLREFRGELREKVRDLGALIEVEGHENVGQYFWRSSAELLDVLVHDVYLGERPYIAVDATVYPWGWEITIFPRKEADRPDVEALLNRLSISVDKDSRYIYPSQFAYDEDLNRIAPVIQDLVDKLSASVG